MANIMVNVGYTDAATAGLKKTSEVAKQLYGDVGKLGTAFKSVSGNLSALSGLSAISFAGLIATAPRLAGDLAMIELGAYKVGDAISQSIKPAVDTFAAGMMGLGDYLERNPWARDLAGGLVLLGTALAGVGILVQVGGLLAVGLEFIVGIVGTLQAIAAADIGFTIFLAGVGAVQTAADGIAAIFGSASLAALAGLVIPVTIAVGLNALLPSKNPAYEATVQKNAASMPVIGSQLGPISDLYQQGSAGLAKLVEPGGDLSNFVNSIMPYTPLGMAAKSANIIITVLDSQGNTLQQYTTSAGSTTPG